MLLIKDSVRTKIWDPRIRAKLSVELGITDQTLKNQIKENSKHLTLASALKVIRAELGLSDEEILYESAN